MGSLDPVPHKGRGSEFASFPSAQTQQNGPEAGYWEGSGCPGPPSPALDGYFHRKATGIDQDIREIYRFEINRLNSFTSWPKSAGAYPTKLAKSGFYYTGESDVVACFVCKVQIAQWERCDIPFKEHKKHSPRCPLVLGTDTTNVPLLSAGSGSGACAALEDDVPMAVKEEEHGGEVFDSVEEPKAEALKEFESLLVKYPFTSLNTDRVKNIIDKFKYKTNGYHQNGYNEQDLPKDIALIEFQSMLDKYPYSSLNLDKAQQILSNFKQNLSEIQRNGYTNQRGMPRNGFHHENAQTNNVATRPVEEPARQAAVADPGEAQAAAALSSLQLNDPSQRGTLNRETQGPSSLNNGRLNQAGGHGIANNGPETSESQSDAVPFSEGIARSNWHSTPTPRRTRGNNDISIISDVLRQLVSEPVMQGVVEYCPKEQLVILAQQPAAQNPQYTHINKRVESFSAWHHGHMQDKRVLAEAGFFYTGQEDRVRCFYCNGGLCNWEKEDIPWYEHERWFGRCQYLQTCKAYSPVVSATIDTAKRINEGGAPPQHCYHQHGYHQGHIRHGETQCDTEQQTQVVDIWSKEATRLALDMGFSRERIQTTVDNNGTGIVDNIERLVEALTGSGSPSPPPPPPARLVTNPPPPPPQTTQRDAAPTGQDSDMEIESLRKENEELRSTRTCKVCLTENISIIFLPCSHLVCCLECGMRLSACPLCRQPIKATSRVYL